MTDTSIVIAIPIALGLLGCWAWYWHRSRIRNDRQELIDLRAALLEALERNRSERARTRIARDIHDELGRELTKINMLIAEVQQRWIPSRRSDQLDRIASLSREVHSKLNDIVWAVDPEHDGIKELVDHAGRCTDRMLQHVPIRVQKHFAHNGPDRRIDPTMKRNIFMLLKEAVNNSIQHASAKHLRVSLETGPDRFRIHVQDDGAGFDPISSIGLGNGLRLMRERAEELGAEFHLVTGIGKGCSIEVSGPLDRTLTLESDIRKAAVR